MLRGMFVASRMTMEMADWLWVSLIRVVGRLNLADQFWDGVSLNRTARRSGCQGSARRPLRMAREESVHKANFVHKKKTERDANQARRNAQSMVKPREAVVGIGKRNDHRSGDEHHPSDRADSKNQQIGHRPFRIPNRRKNQERHCRRPGKPVHQPHNQRPHHLVQPNLPEMAIEPPERSLRGCVGMSFGIVPVRVSMSVIAVTVRMRMAGYH